MTDELTPEERAALKNLPRERMPSAGLEDRVVGAMRDRGLLVEKRRGRVVRITTGRMAGLMAACVALVIGAYSIGLRRGDENDVVRSVAPVRDESTMEIESVTRTEPAQEIPSEASVDANEPANAKKKDEAVEEKRQMARTPQSTGLRKDEPVPSAGDGLAAADRVEEKPATAAPKSALRTNQPPAPTAQLFAQESLAPSTVLQRTFQIGGATFIVDAPDSVRIVEDTEGRMLLIYTSDGLIRIRLAD